MQITHGKLIKPQRVVVYGPEGVGKTSLAAGFPKPLFIDTEGSTDHLDVARAPAVTAWRAVDAVVDSLIANAQGYATVVIDTVDWAERMCAEHLCAHNKKSGIEDFGYGKGYKYLAEEVSKFLKSLDKLREVQNMNVVLVAHSHIRKFEQPDEMGAYDRYELKCTKHVAPLLKEWCDMLLFCNYKTTVVHTDQGKAKAQGGERVMYTTHRPSWDAKNRHNMGDELPLEYASISAHIPDLTKPKPEPVKHEAPDLAPPKAPEKPDLTKPSTHPPSKLTAMMVEGGITAQELQDAVHRQGIFPADMSYTEYPEDFVQSRLIAGWAKVVSNITTHRSK